MTTRKTLLSALLLSLTASLLATPAQARPGNCDGYGPMGGDAQQGVRGERMKQRQQQLHDALKLSPEQEKAWTKYQESNPFMAQGQRPNPADFDKLTAPQRAEKMLELQKQHQEKMSQHVSALKAFYDQLTPEQKKTFDEQHMQRPQRGQRPAAPPAAPN